MKLENGYETISTFWQDFTIADAFGGNAIKDTYKRAFNEWKDDYKMLTELVLVLNWKIWEHYDKDDDAKAHLYNDLWAVAADYARSHLKGDELEYYYATTD